ncbi:protein of unknown function DUF58 [Methanospirillum hungatei JF-1]|jgi:uncharacterized protein (DUF58 family)|uniref:DUF58 domain-containing protein n=1 Tax=Methanospirillum hungatei JF-1 (strain ATCC 27890 / DSM 864 / NBRC 100397 / JF-1) TaxID=323259 RepID=Q2FLN9_METHJ|nr:DUF58 domain-containing protein [Methanospirillum hungatei]ABD40360.1 protein of unknown function DUF58 [Methanospirillum hungatei JF-1]
MPDNTSYSDLIQNVRTIDILTRARVTGQQAGVHISLFKGQGVEFSDIREYIPGDDIRAIDWKITARYQIPYVKEFVEERDHTIYLIADISGSGTFGHVVSKFSTLVSVLATIALSAVHYHDRVGLILVSDKVEKFIPARSGRNHVIHLIQSIITHTSQAGGSDLRPALSMIVQRVRRMSTVILLSDFFTPDCSKELSMVKRHHDLLAIRISDPREEELPDVGLIELEDAESGEQILVDTSNPLVREEYQKATAQHTEKISLMMRKHRIPFVNIRSGDDYVPILKHLMMARPGGEL